VLEASKESPTTVAGGSALGSARVAADCRRAPEDRHDRDCAQEDRDRRQKRRDEDDRGREEADRVGADDDPGTDPDGA